MKFILFNKCMHIERILEFFDDIENILLNDEDLNCDLINEMYRLKFRLLEPTSANELEWIKEQCEIFIRKYHT